MSPALGTMHIVCPNCTTSYAVSPASFGGAGRSVRCARCKEIWLATPEDLPRPAPHQPSMATSPPEADELSAAWGMTDEAEPEAAIPEVESPSISADWPASADAGLQARSEDADWTVMAHQDAGPLHAAAPAKSGKLRKAASQMARGRLDAKHIFPVVTATMAAFALALLIWRIDIVKLMPQTAAFYQAFGLNVNVRGLAFKDVKISTETVDGKPVMVIEGLVVSETRVPTAMPRLRFVVRDAKGTEIYAWSAVLEQPGLNPGDKTWFKSRLASPPAEGRSIDVRFFNKRDVAGA
jgi:predicted Zn finger-like uncharacterized protein